MLFKFESRKGIFFIIFFSSSGSPITPVEAMYISFSGIFNFFESSFTIFTNAFLPELPLKTFALPELTRIAETRPNLIIDLFQITGSPGVFDLVKAPKICPGFSNLIKTRSSLLFFFSPQCVIETLIPSINSILLKDLGIKGDVFEGIMVHFTN